MSIFKGSGVALITPFTKDDSVDFEKLGELLEYHIKIKLMLSLSMVLLERVQLSLMKKSMKS